MSNRTNRAMAKRLAQSVALCLELAALGALPAFLLAAPLKAHAQDAAVQINLPAQPLDDSLIQLGRQTSLQFFYTPETVAGLRAPGVAGRMTAEQALQQLLAGTPVEYRRSGRNITLSRQVSATQLETVTVVGRDGSLPPVYAGGQVATGGRIGLLGNRGFLDTPFSATQYTSQLIEDQQAQNIGDVLVNDPAVRNTYSRGAGRDEFNIRGFTLFNHDVSFNGLYGVAPRNASSLIGVERVEVLRGPNALLNGMAPYGSIGGSINLVPKRAGAEPLNRLTLSYIEDSQIGAHADVARRFGDEQQLGVRLNVLRSGGDMNIDGAGEDMGVVALGVDYRSGRFRIDGDLNYQNRVTDARSGLLFPPAAGVEIGDAPNPRNNFFPSWTYWKAKEWSGAVRAEYDLAPDWTVYGALGGRKHDFESMQANWLMLDDAGTIGARPNRLRESLLSKTAEAGLRGRFQTGALVHEPTLSVSALDIDYSSRRANSDIILSNLYEPADLAKPSITLPGGLGKTSETRLYSVALADTISMADGRVQLTVGLRHQRVRADNFNPDTGDRISDYDKSALTPTVALVVKPTERLTLYGNYIEGLTQGGTAPVGAVNAGETFAPAVSKQFELGAKYDFGAFSTTFSAFQIEQPSAFLDPGTLRYVENGMQRNRGLELLAQGELLRGVRLLGGVAYTDGRLTHTAGGVNDGNHAPAVPRLQFNAAAEWDTPFLDGLTLSLRMLRTSSQYVDVANTQTVPGWTRFDVGARYAFSVDGTPVVVRATIENALNKHYWLSAAREGLTVAAPRTFLLSVSAEF
ncbi:TonB-dependent receptor [Pusillimonas noertemannii]|uniref:Iron complex outermembrane receptor protein n=1 Tax=Pusillimonas noertemannii TaxID=305977 RepID=A0A2U1CQ65_9BURK|nr:TonB-dependent receptor [Pusillimonas noertemannii]PVY68040.1 iron complex outermembrane receptor protein [Pusillimonas noertemannii]